MWSFEDPGRRCLKIEAWPEADRVAWNKAIKTDHVLDDPGAASHWSPATLHKNRRGYGRWLNFLLERDLVARDQKPADRVTKETVRWYRALLESQDLAPYTVVGRIDEIRAVVTAMAPEQDWQWLTALVTRLRACARPLKNKRPRLALSRDLFELGMSLMEEAEASEGRNPVLRAVRFRDGLMIALLAARPLRISNLASIRLGRHLIRQGAGWALLFEPHEMKNRRPFEIAFPQGLEAALDRYLQTWRPALLQDTETDHLWITQYGGPMNSKAANARVTKVTLRAMGKSINPHLFRDCAATSIALEDPEHVHIIASILGHSSLAMAEKHYNQAQSIEAGREHQRLIQDIRNAWRPSRRNGRKRNGQAMRQPIPDNEIIVAARELVERYGTDALEIARNRAKGSGGPTTSPDKDTAWRVLSAVEELVESIDPKKD